MAGKTKTFKFSAYDLHFFLTSVSEIQKEIDHQTRKIKDTDGGVKAVAEVRLESSQKIKKFLEHIISLGMKTKSAKITVEPFVSEHEKLIIGVMKKYGK